MKTAGKPIEMSPGTEDDEDFEDTDECLVDTKSKFTNATDSKQRNLRSGTPNLEAASYKGQSAMRMNHN